MARWSSPWSWWWWSWWSRADDRRRAGSGGFLVDVKVGRAASARRRQQSEPDGTSARSSNADRTRRPACSGVQAPWPPSDTRDRIPTTSAAAAATPNGGTSRNRRGSSSSSWNSSIVGNLRAARTERTQTDPKDAKEPGGAKGTRPGAVKDPGDGNGARRRRGSGTAGIDRTHQKQKEHQDPTPAGEPIRASRAVPVVVVDSRSRLDEPRPGGLPDLQ